MNNIEVEIRSFINEEKYRELLVFFDQNARLIKKDNQETYYFDTEQDLRIQKNDFYAKIWLKSGRLHDEQREEVEVKVDKSYFTKLEKIFLATGHKVKIKWFRKRLEYDWNGLTVCLDHTRGYGYIIELEKMSSPAKKDHDLEILKKKISELGVSLTPKAEFDEKFIYYEKNWKKLIKEE